MKGKLKRKKRKEQAEIAPSVLLLAYQKNIIVSNISVDQVFHVLLPTADNCRFSFVNGVLS